MSQEATKMITTEKEEAASPAFVEAEKMFDKLAEITRETAARAYDFFAERGAQFGTHLEDWLRAESLVLRPAPAEITETVDMVDVKVAAPGFKADEIEISVLDDVLIVSGESQTDEKKEDKNTFYSEWRSNRFMRHLTLPSKVDAETVDARLKDGVLYLAMKKKVTEEATKIAVKAA